MIPPTTIADAIARIQLPVASLDSMINEFVDHNPDFQNRVVFCSDEMRAHARKAAADVTIATTFAQIMATPADFEATLDALEFSEIPNEQIREFKAFMLDKAPSAPRVISDLTDDEIEARFVAMKRRLAS
jgi:hypothetical protein